eukprot:931086-Prymnesium_polylepis.1
MASRCTRYTGTTELSMSSPASLALAKQVRTMSLRSFLNQTAAAVPAFGSRHVKKSLTESSP